MNVLVIGANGQVGKQVIQLLKNTEHSSVALVRNEKQAFDLKDLGADKVVIGDLEGDISHAFSDVEVVIFTAGSGGKTGADKTILVDLWGSMKAVDIAEKSGIKHFIQVSATNSPDPDAEVKEFRPYAVAKHISDRYIRQSSLNYTIIQPGPLLNEEATGKIKVSLSLEEHPNNYQIPRIDVASVLIQAIDNEGLKNKSIFIKSGDTDIKEALKLN
ncbi:SDR family oxidoreductase [Peribacillus frigoritolerans]|uniref:SDR family oxidoreductase n=1 Tax=Peribacillus frigoritolerans TaxID=450367 RepID=UPI003519912B